MALIVEDGTGNTPDANSYQSLDDLRMYAELRGVTLPTADADCNALMIKAMDYLEAQRSKYKGRITSASQPLQWPRADVVGIEWEGNIHPNNEIPRELIYAQLALAVEAVNHDLQPTRTPQDQGPLVSSDTASAIKKAWANPGKVLSVPAFAKADALLAPLFKRNGLSLVRS